MTTAAPDHTAEYTRADNAIRLLAASLAALRHASGLLDETDTTAERLAIYAANDATKGAIETIKEAIKREVARRDAAELAQRAAAPASLFPSPERLAWERNR